MTKTFKPISPKKIQDNPFVMLDNDWMLITAGTKHSYNMMTAAWGGMGILWKKPVAYIFIRPTRYTYQFTEKHDYFTLTFFEEKYREILSICGTKSGRDFNKMKEVNLTPAETKKGNIYFQEARLVMECRKLYKDDIREPNFLSKEPLKNYPLKDYHRMYIGEIEECLAEI
ncbi:MAG: flavin reductase [Bacteroidia bacterium]|nr:flavin reductase [Bacteroidia bacterium]